MDSSSNGTTWLSPPMKMRTPSALLDTSSSRISCAFSSKRSKARRSCPMSLEKSVTDSRLRSPEITTSSACASVSTSELTCTAACISAAISPRSFSTSDCRRSRTCSIVRPAKCALM
ncbi:hypothetical protein D9M68_800940 [compost metagenome]